MAEAGLDLPADYAFHLFEKLDSVESDKQIDLRALVTFARRVVAATPVERELIVLSHGSLPLGAAERFGNKPNKRVTSYGIWGDMLVRWSQDFLQKLNMTASARTKRSLGIKTLRAYESYFTKTALGQSRRGRAEDN